MFGTMARRLLRLLCLAYVHMSSTTTSEAATGNVGFSVEGEEVPVVQQGSPLPRDLLLAVSPQHSSNLLHPRYRLQLQLLVQVCKPPARARQASQCHTSRVHAQLVREQLIVNACRYTICVW